MNIEKITKLIQSKADVIAQLKKAGITISNNELNPLANPGLEKFFKSPQGTDARAMNLYTINYIKKGGG